MISDKLMILNILLKQEWKKKPAKPAIPLILAVDAMRIYLWNHRLCPPMAQYRNRI